MAWHKDPWTRFGVDDPLTVRSGEGAFECYVARPVNAAAPVVILLDGEVRAGAPAKEIADRFAFDGFIAVCPDLSHHLPPVRPMTATSSGLCRHGWNVEACVDDLVAIVDLARRLGGAAGPVAMVGWGPGSFLTFATALRSRLDAAVLYAEGDLDAHLPQLEDVSRPMLIHLPLLEPARLACLERWLDDHPWIELEAKHGPTRLGFGRDRPRGWADALTRRFLIQRVAHARR